MLWHSYRFTENTEDFMFVKNIIAQTSIPVASKGLDAYMTRSRATANNIANVTTKGYERIEVSFEDQLQGAMDSKRLSGDRTQAAHMFLGRNELDKVHAEAYRVEDQTNAAEFNNVDIDIENAKMAENQIQYNFAVKFIKERMQDITTSIKLSRG
jgi:flagellar basal-body rod protein FlgB